MGKTAGLGSTWVSVGAKGRLKYRGNKKYEPMTFQPSDQPK